MDGVLIIDKPEGVTSHDVVNEVRRALHVRRVGHTGTLDPFATGVLVILIGRATRLAQFLSGLEKEYEAVIRLGYATTTGDRTGEIVGDRRPQLNAWTEDQIATALGAFGGDISQIPPMYSAKKYEGKKLYELARRGEEVERKPVSVCIHEFEAVGSGGELLKDNLDGTFDLKVRVKCSAGTYIRTLAEDFGKKLGVGAHVAELRRSAVGDFRIGAAKTISDLKVSIAEEGLGKVLLTMDDSLARLPVVELNDSDVRRVRNGLPVDGAEAKLDDGAYVRLRDARSNLVAVGKFDAASRTIRPSVVIAREDS